VLPHICRKIGRADSSRPMPYKTFVLFLCSALMHIGVSAEAAKVFSAQCMRGGGATEAAVHGLSLQLRSSTWQALRTQTGWPTTTGTTWGNACASRAPWASDEAHWVVGRGLCCRRASSACQSELPFCFAASNHPMCFV